MKFPYEDKSEKDDDDEDDRDGDADQYGSVVGVSADGLGPGGLTELVRGSVGSDLRLPSLLYQSEFTVCTSVI